MSGDEYIVKDEDITASSMYADVEGAGPARSRLNTKSNWKPNEPGTGL